MKYRKKPVVIEAIKYTGTNFFEIDMFCAHDARTEPHIPQSCILIETLEGPLNCKPGDWIVKGIKGEFYPVKNDVFLLSYEKVIDD